jgi:hypothetical protein
MDLNKNYAQIIKYVIVVHQQQLDKQQPQQHFEHPLFLLELVDVKQ